MRHAFHSIRTWLRRRAYKPGRVLSRFIARDVRREIKVVSANQIDDGIIVAQVRTNNLLYLHKGLTEEEKFGEPVTLEIATMWDWPGEPWGGLPDGTSIADQIEDKDSD